MSTNYRVEAEKCKYRSKMRIGLEEWEWCSFFNAKLDDVNCKTCIHKVEKQPDLETLEKLWSQTII